jgi:hypothetical protein
VNTETMARFAQRVEDDLVALHNRLDVGELTMPDFVALATVLLVRARAAGVAVADLALAAELSVLLGRAVPALGLPVPDELLTTAHAAVEDTVTSPQYQVNAAAAVAVLGRSQALEAVQDAYTEGLRERRVPAWTRVLNGGACGLCADLAGDVLPGHAEMYHHKGCGCSQRPIMEGETP